MAAAHSRSIAHRTQPLHPQRSVCAAVALHCTAAPLARFHLHVGRCPQPAHATRCCGAVIAAQCLVLTSHPSPQLPAPSISRRSFCYQHHRCSSCTTQPLNYAIRLTSCSHPSAGHWLPLRLLPSSHTAASRTFVRMVQTLSRTLSSSLHLGPHTGRDGTAGCLYRAHLSQPTRSVLRLHTRTQRVCASRVIPFQPRARTRVVRALAAAKGRGARGNKYLILSEGAQLSHALRPSSDEGSAGTATAPHDHTTH